MATTYRTPLNKKQLQVLYTLYKYRFGTEQLLSKSLNNITRRTMHERVRILNEQEYIGRRYNGKDRLAGKPAYYYLLPKGIAILKAKPDVFTYQVLRNIRKDINASESFIEHTANIFGLSCRFKELYGDTIDFFTKSLLTSYDYFPRPLPDAYVSFKKDHKGRTLAHIMVECFDETMPDFAMKKRIDDLVEHADSGEWTPKAPYPNILFVCMSEDLEKKVRKWISKALQGGWTDDLVMVATTKQALHSTIEAL